MVVLVNTHIFNAFEQYFRSPLNTDMRKPAYVIHFFNSVKDEETANWVRDNEILYLRGFAEGFEIDNTQEAQLKDLLKNTK